MYGESSACITNNRIVYDFWCMGASTHVRAYPIAQSPKALAPQHSFSRECIPTADPLRCFKIPSTSIPPAYLLAALQSVSHRLTATRDMEWQPYNISFDDKSALFYYEPYRGGYDNYTGLTEPAYQTTWVVYNTTGRVRFACSSFHPLTVSQESSYTTSFGGASVTLQLPAMVSAFWVYGECDASAITIDRSWSGDAILNNATPAGGGVLYSEGGLTQDLNSIRFTVNDGKGPVTITGATVAIGMGTRG